MNALYDAPVDADGKPVFADVDPHDRTTYALAAPGVDPLRRDRGRVRDRRARSLRSAREEHDPRRTSTSASPRPIRSIARPTVRGSASISSRTRRRRTSSTSRTASRPRSCARSIAARRRRCASSGCSSIRAAPRCSSRDRSRRIWRRVAERQFGPYRLVRQIAVGGMAEIHLAKTKGIAGFEKYVALKMIHPNFAEDDQFIQMLVDEAKIAVQLTHGNIAQTFDLGRVGDTYYITMEYVDGSDLYKILRRGSETDLEMPLDVCAFIGKEVASALDYAHRKRDHTGTLARHRASRRVAAERARVLRGRGQARRLRHREGDDEGAPDRGRRDQGQVLLHEPRAGVGRSDRLRAPTSSRPASCSTR